MCTKSILFAENPCVSSSKAVPKRRKKSVDLILQRTQAEQRANKYSSNNVKLIGVDFEDLSCYIHTSM